MKKVIKLCVLVLLPFTTFSQTIEWKKCYGGTDEERAYEIIACPDNEFLIVGYTKSDDGDVAVNHGSGDFWLVKINADGDILWEKTYGGTNYEGAFAITGAQDGGFVIAGRKNFIDGNPTNSDFWVIKINSSGVVEWENTYGGSSFDIPSEIILTQDNGFIISGVTRSDDGDVTGNNSNKWAAWIVKINASGTLIWEKCFHISDCINFGAAIGTPDDGLIFAIDVCQTDSDYIIIRLDDEGEVIWEKSYGGSLNDLPHAICKGYENMGYFVVGQSASNDGDILGNHGSFDFWVVNIDEDGELINSYCYGGSDPDIAYDIMAHGNSELLIAGVTESDDGDVKNEDDFGDFWIINTTYDGTLNWQMKLGDSIGRDVARSIVPVGSDAFIVAGYSCSEEGEVVTGHHGMTDFWVIKINTTTNSTENTLNSGKLEISPNPSSRYITLQADGIKRAELIDINGRIVRSFVKDFDQLDISGFQKGIYLIRVFTAEGTAISKVILE